MNRKSWDVLELDKILARLTAYASFSASEALLRELEPTPDLEEAQRRQQETSQARDLLEEHTSASIGGAHDVRPQARSAAIGVVLTPLALLDIKGTLLAGAELRKTMDRVADRFPMLAKTAEGIDENKGIVVAIERVVDERGEVLDSASPKLTELRRSLRVAHDRLHTKLQAMVSSGTYGQYLQEALITMRGGRYVIPVKAEHKGRIKGIVHDQSSSGQTLYIEPMATVEINNEIRELELAEEDEVRRILGELSALVGERADSIVWTVEALADLDAAFARAKYANAIRGVGPVLVGFDSRRIPGSTIHLVGARHPLLNPQTAVPIDVELADDTFVLIITGPNTGGKTVSLKTVGLLTLMAQCGLHVPAAEATLTVFGDVYADIGDEQSIEQSLSTFSAHLTHIIELLAAADSQSLVVIDELGSGTDPAEGSAIARAILDDFVQRGVTCFVATHYPELKLYAHSTPGVRNASVEFDVETLSPTYRLIIGLPGRSNAIAIATRLGLPPSIIEAAQALVGEADLQTDALLDEIHQTREEIRETQARLAAAEKDATILRDRLTARLKDIDEDRRKILNRARKQAEEELETFQAEIAEQRRRLRATFPLQTAEAAAELKAIEEQVAELEETVETPAAHSVRVQPPVVQPPRALRAGDRVYIPSLNAEGEIADIDASGDAEVQVGQLRVRVDLDALEWRAGRPPRDETPSSYEAEGVRMPTAESPGLELQLRGMTVVEALSLVDEYLDQAYRAGLPWVRIIHGKGTGALRRAIRDALRGHPLVKQFGSAADNEGGDGATVVTLASSN